MGRGEKEGGRKRRKEGGREYDQGSITNTKLRENSKQQPASEQTMEMLMRGN